MKQLLLLSILVSVSGCSGLKKVGVKAPDRKKQTFHVAWSKNLDPVYESGNLPIGMGSPLIVEDMLFMGSLDGYMRCFDLATGRLLWEQNEKQPIAAKPTLFGNQIVYGSQMGRLFSRDLTNGKLKYSIDLGEPIESEPLIHNGHMLVHMRGHQLVALDANTGKIFWSYKRSVPYTSTLQRVSRPIIHQGKIILGFADGAVGALSLEEGVILWERRVTNNHKFVDVDVDPILFNDKIVIGSANGPLSFLSAENGLIIRSVDVVMGHTPIIYEDQLIVGTTFGQLVKLDSEGGIILRKKVSDSSISSIVPWKGKLAVSTMGQHLLWVDPLDFNPLAKHLLGSSISSIFGYLQESQGYLAAYSSRNRLYIFK